MWATAQRDGRPAEYRWRPVLNAPKFGSRPLLEYRAKKRYIKYSSFPSFPNAANRRVQDLEDAK